MKEDWTDKVSTDDSVTRSDQLKGRVALITGAARGIGKAIAEAFAVCGARIGIVDVLEKELQNTSDELKNMGTTTLSVVTDISDVEQVDAMVKRVEAELGPIAVLVNNAGTFSYIGPVWEADPQKWFRDVQVNLYGTFLCCRAVVKEMVERKDGYVINMMGGGIQGPSPYNTSYASSKTGLMRLTESLAEEVKVHGVKVFGVLPGTVLTEMTRFIMNDPGGKKWRPNFHRTFDAGNDWPPEAVAEITVQLASGRAENLTGRCFSARHDFKDMLDRAEEIIDKDLHSLRVRWLPR
jgi:NAD(P)-dependent dehydrogenase (short-subunit alcohol dehydrogenase family)